MPEIIELDGGYAVLEDRGENGWEIDTFSHWDNIVPTRSLGGCDSREEALESLDDDDYDGESGSPRDAVKNYQYALTENCKRLGIEIPPKLPPR